MYPSSMVLDYKDDGELSTSSSEISRSATRAPRIFDHETPMTVNASDEEVIVNYSQFQPKTRATSQNLFVVETSPTSDTDNEKQEVDHRHMVYTKADSRGDTDELEAIKSSQLVCPRSRCEGYVPPLPISAESSAIEDIIGDMAGKSHSASREMCDKREILLDEGSFIEIELSEFVIYLPDGKYHPYEFRPLQDLTSKNGHARYLFDGILSTGNKHRYVQSVPFEICSVGNYGKDMHEVGDHIWIQSNLNANSQVYYRLKSPAPEYSRFHESFKWLANLAKHFVDYCQAEEGRLVSLHNFREDFSQWMQKMHTGSACFLEWFSKHGSDDFRQSVATNIDFLFKESVGIDHDLQIHPVWNQLMYHDYIPYHVPKTSKTIVTPYVYDCFKDSRFGHQLQSVTPAKNALARCLLQGTKLDLRLEDMNVRTSNVIPSPIAVGARNVSSRVALTAPAYKRGAVESSAERKAKVDAIHAGDVLSVTKDGADSVWKDEVSRWKALDNCWYIYVQDTHDLNGKRSFGGLWLYKPSDTCCAKMKYLYKNELFLSDNCTCSKGRIYEEEVIDVVHIEWHGDPLESGSGLFVRQTYLENERFVTLQDAHKTCEHLKIKDKSHSASAFQKYPIGQTVLAPASRLKAKYGLEPCEIVEYINTASRIFVVLRRLMRRCDMRGQLHCRPNELVYTENTFKIEATRVNRTCLVRFYTQSEATSRSIPTPYDRDGTGNAFYITTRLVETPGEEGLEPIHNNFPQSLIEGFDPLEPICRRRLRGLDLYCGGGSFGRGLEEGGALHNDYAVDCAKVPIHTYFANLKDPNETQLFHGSVNDQLYEALHCNHKNVKSIPLPGDVDFISAGSPCQGFSMLNSHKNNERGLRNQSLVASVASYIDFYRPKYGILENVMTMAQKGMGRDEDILSQLVCAIVGLGYQLELFVLDAWSCGSPQSRSRIFITFTAPGHEPIRHPEPSHSHPPQLKNRGLGKLANGKNFGQRIWESTPFKYVTAAAAIADLPEIGDGRTYNCTSFPDHVLSIQPNNILHKQILAIPTYPRGSNFSSSWNEGKGVISKEQRAVFPELLRNGKTPESVARKSSKAWGRVHPQSLFNTVVGQPVPACSRMGRILHWDQPRPITVMEARRAQSFPDDEVLLGPAYAKWAVIGNSVDRSVSLALGLLLREVWLKNGPKAGNFEAKIDQTASTSATMRANSTLNRGVVKGRVIANAAESSDEDALSSQRLNSPVRAAFLRQGSRESTPTNYIDSLDKGGKSLTRPHGMPKETRITPSAKDYKSPRLLGGVVPSHLRVSDPVDVRSGDKIQVTLLHDSERKLDGEYVDSKRQIESRISRNASSTLLKRSRYNAPTSTSQQRFGYKGRSKQNIKWASKTPRMPKIHPCIEETSDNVHDSDVTDARDDLPAEKLNRYVPVDNRNFLAYAQTNRIMNYSRYRKHGPKETW